MECVFRQFIIQPIMIWLAIKPPLNVPPQRKYSKVPGSGLKELTKNYEITKKINAS